MDVAELFGHVVHQEILAEGVRSGEVGLSPGDLGHLLDEGDEIVVLGQHEGVDQDPGSAAGHHLSEGLVENPWIKSHGIFIDPAIGERDGRGLAVGDHDDLAHILPLSLQDSLGKPQPLLGVGVIRSDGDSR